MSDLLCTLVRDSERYRPLGGIHRNLGFWMVATHRLQQRARAIKSPLLGMSLRATCKAAATVWRSIWGVSLSDDASIGPGFCLIHPRDVVVGPARIGENCLVFHEVTIEGGILGPRLGDRIDVYAGAKVMGDVQIGSDAKIGANCVVTTDVAPGCDVVTAANRVIPASIASAFGCPPQRTTPPSTESAPRSTHPTIPETPPMRRELP